MDLTPGQAAKPSLKRSCPLRITQEVQELETSETYGLVVEIGLFQRVCIEIFQSCGFVGGGELTTFT